MDDITLNSDIPIKKERKKRVPKVISELNESIKLQLKKERVFSKVNIDEYTNDIDYLGTIIDSIVYIDKITINKSYIYILDKIYHDKDIRYLIGAPDSYVFIINNTDIYDIIYNSKFLVSSNIELFFYDLINGLVKYNRSL